MEISRSLLPTSPWGLLLLLAPRKSQTGENLLFGDCPGCDQSTSYSHQPVNTQPSGKLKSGSHSNYHPLPLPALGGLEKTFVNAGVISPSSASAMCGGARVVVPLQLSCPRATCRDLRGLGCLIWSHSNVDLKVLCFSI